jgi:hypothetical protein
VSGGVFGVLENGGTLVLEFRDATRELEGADLFHIALEV